MSETYNKIQSNLDLSKLSPEKQKRLLNYIERKEKGEDVGDFIYDYPKTKDETKIWDFKFWNKKPVVITIHPVHVIDIIDQNLKSKFISQNKMLDPYTWIDFNLSDDNQIENVCTFLNKNYKINNKDNFRLYYTKDYLRWSLGTSGKIIGIHSNGTIGGIIAASIRECQIFKTKLNIADINYFCIHSKLREKGLAEMFIDEITRRMCDENIIVGTFTTQRYIPTPICKIEFFHRPLNYEKLCQVNFLKPAKKIEHDNMVSAFMIRYKHKHKVIKINKKNMNDVYELFCRYQDKFNYYQIYSREEFEYYFMNNEIVSTYVILDEYDDVLDFYSYYKLPYYVVESERNNKIPKYLNSVYMFMYTSLNVTQLTIFKSAIRSAYDEGNDIFTCTDIMENTDILYDNLSKFSKGNGYLYYNFYNLTCPQISPQQICKLTL